MPWVICTIYPAVNSTVGFATREFMGPLGHGGWACHGCEALRIFLERTMWRGNV